MTLSLRILLNRRVVALQFISVSIEVIPSFVLDDNYGAQGQKKSKNDAKPGNDSQEVARDKSTQQYGVFRYKAYQKLWHKSGQELPPSQLIDIPYLKQLDTCVIVPIAYCEKGDVNIVTNFVPAYLASVTRRLWELYDEEVYVLDKLKWDEEENTILAAFETSIQHPEEHVV